MAKSFKDEYAIFPTGAQRSLFESLAGQFSVAEMARICACSERTIRDWRREKFPIQLAAMRALCKAAHMTPPKNITIRHRYSHLKSASRKGMRTVVAKYGRIPVDEERRTAGWKKWWEAKGKSHLSPILQPKSIRKPEKNALLAEFIGIMMGDGGISQYQAVITLHHKDDLAYSRFVVSLMQKLFGVMPRVYHSPKDSTNNIVTSRRILVEFLHKMGLPIGNKIRQDLDIPIWIKKEKKLLIACLRGLMDTDGSVLIHSYKSKGKLYSYKKLSFCSHSVPLQKSVAKILADFGMRPRLDGYNVRLESVSDVKKYFSIVGSNNPKHLIRYSR